MSKYVTKDNGERNTYMSGMLREPGAGKARFDLLMPLGVPYRAQFLTRCAELLERGARKYAPRNWEQASGQAELDDFKSSAFRHFAQWMAGEDDEDHAAAVFFNIMGYETTKWKRENSDD